MAPQSLALAAPFPVILADLVMNLRVGKSCLVQADKGWAMQISHEIGERLRALNVEFVYLDGKPSQDQSVPEDFGVMLLTIAQLRQSVRTSGEGGVLIMPHLDVMGALQGGLTPTSRELIPLLYENPSVILLGFQDRSLRLLPVIEKLFHHRFTIDIPFREQSEWEPASRESTPEDAGRNRKGEG